MSDTETPDHCKPEPGGSTRRDFIVGASVAGAVLLAGADTAAAQDPDPIVVNQDEVKASPARKAFLIAPHPNRPTCVAVTADHRAVTCNDEGKVHLWNLPPQGGDPTKFKKLRKVKAAYVTVSKAEPEQVLAGHFDGVVTISNLLDRKRKGVFDDHLMETGPGTEVWAVAVHHATTTGLRAISGTNGGEIRYWDVTGTHTLAWWGADGDPVAALAFLPNGSHFISGHGHGRTILWRINGNVLQPLTEFSDGSLHQINSVAVFTRPNGLHVITGSFDGHVRIWKLPNPLPAAPTQPINMTTKKFPKHNHYVWRVAASPSGDRFASAGEDEKVKFFDFENVALNPAEVDVSNGSMGVDFDGQNRAVFTTGALENEVGFVDIP